MTLLPRLAFCAALLLLAGRAAAEPVIEHLRPDTLMSAPGFSQTSTATGGKLVLVSGQVWPGTRPGSPSTLATWRPRRA
jgi:hypothetical protein